MSTVPKRASFLLVAILASALLPGCGRTRLDVVKPFRPQFQALRKQMAEMAAMEPNEPIRPTTPLDPKPVLKDTYPVSDPESNMAIFMFEQLTDPNADVTAKSKPDAFLTGGVLLPIRLAAMPDAELKRKAIDGEDKELAAALTVRYIGAIKIVEHQPPVVLDGKNFQVGRVKGIVMLFDRQKMKPVFADGFKAQNDSKVSVKGNSYGWLTSNLSGTMRAAVIKTVTDGTGAKFEVKEWQ